jgi:hypothetical protein
MIFAGILLVVLTVMIGVVCVSVILSNRQVSESDTESQVKDERSRTNKRPGESTGYSRLPKK